MIFTSKLYTNSKGQLLMAVPKQIERELGLQAHTDYDIVPRKSGGGFIVKLKKCPKKA